MCGPDAPPPPPPPPQAPPVLEQQAPKSASNSESKSAKKRKGLSAYKIDTPTNTGRSNKLGGIPAKTGTGS